MKMKNMSTLIKTAIVCLIVFGSIAPINQAFGAQFKCKIISSMPNSGADAYVQKFANLLSKKSNGEIDIKVYGMGELGSQQQQAELLQSGAVQISIVDPGHYSTTIKELELFNLFFLLPRDMNKLKKVLSNKDAKWLQILEAGFNKLDMKIMNFLPMGRAVWTSNSPLNSLEDFKGFKIRVMTSPLLVETYKLLGANPTALPFGELYSALQLGLVDGQDNPLFLAELVKFYEVQDYITFSHHLSHMELIAMNQSWFNSLPEKYKNLIFEVEKECYDEFYVLKDEEEKKAKANIIKAKPGIVFNKLSKQNIELFKQAILPAKNTFIKITGKNGEAILESLQEEIKKVK